MTIRLKNGHAVVLRATALGCDSKVVRGGCRVPRLRGHATRKRGKTKDSVGRACASPHCIAHRIDRLQLLDGLRGQHGKLVQPRNASVGRASWLTSTLSARCPHCVAELLQVIENGRLNGHQGRRLLVVVLLVVVLLMLLMLLMLPSLCAVKCGWSRCRRGQKRSCRGDEESGYSPGRVWRRA